MYCVYVPVTTLWNFVMLILWLDTDGENKKYCGKSCNANKVPQYADYKRKILYWHVNHVFLYNKGHKCIV